MKTIEEVTLLLLDDAKTPDDYRQFLNELAADSMPAVEKLDLLMYRGDGRVTLVQSLSSLIARYLDKETNRQLLNLLKQLFAAKEISLAMKMNFLLQTDIGNNTLGAVLELYQDLEIVELYIDFLIAHIPANEIIKIFSIPNDMKEVFGFGLLKNPAAASIFKKCLDLFIRSTIEKRVIVIADLMVFLQQANKYGFNWGTQIAKFQHNEELMLQYLSLLKNLFIGEQVSAEFLLKFLRQETQQEWNFGWIVASNWPNTQVSRSFYDFIFELLKNLKEEISVTEVHYYLNSAFVRDRYLQITEVNQSIDEIFLQTFQQIPQASLRKQLYGQLMSHANSQKCTALNAEKYSLNRVELLIQIMNKYGFNGNEALAWNQHGTQVYLLLKGLINKEGEAVILADDICTEIISQLTGLTVDKASSFAGKILASIQSKQLSKPLVAINPATVFYQKDNEMDERVKVAANTVNVI